MALKRAQLKRGTKRLARKGLKPRRASKRATVDGDSERSIRDENDELVRKIIRLRGGSCFTCGATERQRDLHPGHYITRKVLAIRWSFENIRRQCNYCNAKHQTEPERYRLLLVAYIGNYRVEELERIAKENPRLEYFDLLAIRDELRTELARLR